MTSLSDTLTVGLVLVLLFGSIALYLYTRIQQAEQKISLLESILLDLKMSSEIKSYSELPAENSVGATGGQNDKNYTPFNDDDNDNDNEVFGEVAVTDPSTLKSGNQTSSVSDSVNDTSNITEYKSIIADTVSEVKDNASKVSANYEAMTLKELQTHAKTRGISATGKKSAIIEALKTLDRSSETVQPGSFGGSTGSFLETSAPFQTSATDTAAATAESE